MGSNSFLLKGWSITLIIAMLTFAISLDEDIFESEAEKIYLLCLAGALVVVFWALDAFYLSQEKAYRDLYKEVSLKDEGEISFSLDVKKFLNDENSWFRSLFAPVFLVFYAPALGLVLFITIHLSGISLCF